ncbi:MAG: hypothetical protein HN350_16155 [Phycisphaerales bacterium]|jgi:hypothetical protein|nr:hypothetical protein [Phycisphaerales bacterium]
MIGGVDIVIPTGADRRNAMVVSLRLIKRIWPDAVVEDADSDSGDKTAIGGGALIPEMMTDAFVYQNSEMALKWDELGAEPELADTMIHILVRNEEVTVVVDDPELESAQKFISGMRSALRMNIFAMATPHRGAAA